MRSWRLRAIAGACLFAFLTVATAGIAVPEPVRVVLGAPLILLLSGFAVVCLVFPGQQLSRDERLLASLGLSLAMTTCVAVILAATPIGLSRTSFAVALGGITVAVSVCAWFRTRAQQATRQLVAGPPIIGYVADSEHDEAAFVAEEADRRTDEGEATPGQVTVVHRTNAHSRASEEVFIRAGLPYKVVGGLSFYERREVRDLLAYLRLIADPEDEVSLRRVLNVPRRGIGDRTKEQVTTIARWDRTSFAATLARPVDVPGLTPQAVRAIEGFNELLGGLRADADAGVPVAGIAEAVLERSGYLAELEASSDLQDAGRIENLQKLVRVARAFDVLCGQADPPDPDPDTPGPARGSLADFLKQVSLVAPRLDPGDRGPER